MPVPLPNGSVLKLRSARAPPQESWTNVPSLPGHETTASRRAFSTPDTPAREALNALSRQPPVR
jgi:hypothetical protein